MRGWIKHGKTMAWVGLLAVLPLGASFVAAAPLPQPIGYVVRVEGPAYVSIRGNTLVAMSGQVVLSGSKLETGPQGALGVILIDGTIIALGAESEMRLEDVRFDPARKSLLLQARFERGMLSLLAGEIAKLDPQAMRLQTPHGTIRVTDGAHVLIKAVQ
ncbi:FecR family protein [Azomonas macrocytogenes]|uniref:FecR protein domain-containing protein n=1 Tax=Azomonas macrocytogenes TaxID=69962 RepID=A0A839T1Q2_AZOMA|nr:FecR family protein [Azomonas macrocytogenes]MBB3103487.1 hypothetical protein [Azomonas macrocytogenes]